MDWFKFHGKKFLTDEKTAEWDFATIGIFAETMSIISAFGEGGTIPLALFRRISRKENDSESRIKSHLNGFEEIFSIDGATLICRHWSRYQSEYEKRRVRRVSGHFTVKCPSTDRSMSVECPDTSRSSVGELTAPEVEVEVEVEVEKKKIKTNQPPTPFLGGVEISASHPKTETKSKPETENAHKSTEARLDDKVVSEAWAVIESVYPAKDGALGNRFDVARNRLKRMILNLHPPLDLAVVKRGVENYAKNKQINPAYKVKKIQDWIESQDWKGWQAEPEASGVVKDEVERWAAGRKARGL